MTDRELSILRDRVARARIERAGGFKRVENLEAVLERLAMPPDFTAAKSCLVCSTSFVPKAHNAIYCSTRCRERSKGIRKVPAAPTIRASDLAAELRAMGGRGIFRGCRTCPECSTRFQRKPRTRAVYCSSRCQQRHYHRTRRAVDPGFAARERETVRAYAARRRERLSLAA
jgi:hypothetical protein